MEQSLGISAVDVFCGAAGLSFGLQQSGIKIAAGIDMDPACRYPFEANVGGKFVQQDIATLGSVEIAKLFEEGSIRVLAGCAPCQPFSGYTTRRRATDGRWQLLLDFLRIVQDILPEVVTLENVSRLVQLPLWNEFTSGLQNSGYHVAWKVIDASEYGVPQNRKRLVLLASRLGPISLPTPIGKKDTTVKQAISHLPKISAGEQSQTDFLHASRALTDLNLARIRSSKPAGTWREWPKELQVDCHKTPAGKTYPSVYGRMSWDKPAPTITTQFYGFGNGRFGHPEQDRAITLREGAILQSFPSDFKFCPKNRKLNFRLVGRLIGNAVPPALAHAIGSAIVSHVSGFSK